MSTAVVSHWVVDPSHSLIEFSVKHMMIATVKGQFSGVEGVIYADPADLTTAKFEGTVDVATVNTRDADRDAHLRSADFFNAAVHPKMTLRSTKVVRIGDDYEATCLLTIRGVTKEVPFTVTYEGAGRDPWGGERIALNLSAKVNRKEYGLVWNVDLESGGVLVSEDVKISLVLQAVKKA